MPSNQLGVREWCAVVLGLIACAAGCKSESQVQTAAPPPPEVTISQVVERAVIDYEEFTGRMESAENVEIRARVHGYLTKVSFVDGDEVNAGTLLFEIDSRPFEAQLSFAEGQKAQWLAKRDKAQSDVTRYEGLVPTGAASAQDLDKARAELGEAVAAIQSTEASIAQAKLDLEFSKITAPIDGQLSRALITKGNLVQSGTGSDALLTTMVSLDPMYAYFDVDERSLLRLRERERATLPESAAQPTVADLKIPIQLGLANDDGYPYQGVINFAENRVDASTGTIRVRGTFDNSKRILKPGLFARVRIPVSEQYQALLVTEPAFGIDQGRKYVYVVDDKGLAEKRFVKVGPTQDDGLQVVAEGLKSGEWVVVNGLQRVRLGKPVTPQRVEMPTLRIGPDTSTTSQPPVTVKPS